jgi:hypothetical protein
MMINRATSSENDVLYQFALSYRHPDPQLLDDFARRYPEYAAALTTLAIELTLEEWSSKEDEAVTESAEIDTESAAILSRAMSRFQNRLHTVRSAQAAALRTWERTEGLRDPFALRSPEEMQIVIQTLDVSPLFVMRLRDRGIEAGTMTAGFIRRVAAVLQEPETLVRAHFEAPPQMQGGAHYRSDVTPNAGRKLSFEEAVRTSGLTAEQQSRLLAL